MGYFHHSSAMIATLPLSILPQCQGGLERGIGRTIAAVVRSFAHGACDAWTVRTVRLFCLDKAWSNELATLGIAAVYFVLGVEFQLGVAEFGQRFLVHGLFYYFYGYGCFAAFWGE